MIIDLACCEADRPTALDFARLEVGLWQEVFAEIREPEDALLSTFIHLRDCLDGRARPLVETDLPRHAPGFLQIACTIRMHAADMLRASLPNYLLEDYFTALYFQHMYSLSYENVDATAARLALSGAALSLQFLRDLDAGRYAENAREPLQSPIFEYEELSAAASNPARHINQAQQWSSPEAIRLLDKLIAVSPDGARETLEALRGPNDRGRP